MRVTLLKLSLLTMAFAFPTLAEDHFLGTWKLDLAKSKYSPGPPPQSITTVISAEGDWIVVKTETVSSDGKATSNSNRYKRDGKEHPWNVADSTGKQTTIAVKLVDDHNTIGTMKTDGKATTTTKSKISKDGKTRTMTTTGIDSTGKKVSNVAVYTRQ